MIKVGILGNGRHAAEVCSYIDEDVIFYAVQKDYLSKNCINIELPTNKQLFTPVVSAVGSPAVRKKLLEIWKGNEFFIALSPGAIVDGTARIGLGSQVAPLSIIMTGANVGKHCIINIHSSVSHDCVLGDYVTLSPGVHLGGGVNVGAGAFIGIGATIIDGVKIASGVVVGAGAVVVRDLTIENGVYVGNPARIIKTNEGWFL